LFGDAASAADVAAFEDEGGLSGAGEIRAAVRPLWPASMMTASKIEFERVDMWLTDGQNKARPRLKKPTKAQEKSH